MRIAEGGEHTAEICGNVLQNVSHRHIFFLARCVQDKKSERQKGQQSHVVCNQHRADKGDINESKHGKPCVFKVFYNFSCNSVEKPDVSQSAHHSENAEKTGESLEIKIRKIKTVRRNEKNGYKSANTRNNSDNVVFDNRPKKI